MTLTVKALPEASSGSSAIIGWGVDGGAAFRFTSTVDGSTVDITQIHYNSGSDCLRLIFDPDSTGIDVDTPSNSVFPPNLSVKVAGYTFDQNGGGVASANPLKTEVRFDFTGTGVALVDGVAPSPELTIQHELGASQTLNHTGRRFIDRDRDSQYFYHSQYDTESIDYQIDFSRPLTDRGASITTVEWSVKYGSATLTNQITKDGIAQITVANPKSDKALIQCKTTDTSGAIRVRYIEIKVIDPDYTLKDYS